MEEEHDTKHDTPNVNDEDEATASTNVSIEKTEAETECDESMGVDVVETEVDSNAVDDANVEGANVGEGEASPVEMVENDEEKRGEAVNADVDKNDGASDSTMSMDVVGTDPEPMMAEKTLENVDVEDRVRFVTRQELIDCGKQNKLGDDFDVAIDRLNEVNPFLARGFVCALLVSCSSYFAL